MPKYDAVLVFAKLPEPGQVKTRLGGVLGPEQAAGLHRACIADTLALVAPLRGCRKFFFHASENAPSDARVGLPALPVEWNVAEQRGRDLGTRLEHAFCTAFRSGARRVVCIGTDTPWMGSQRILQALHWLHEVDVVLGPSLDGGYYLIGTRGPLPILFRRMPWGTSRLYQTTLRTMHRSRLSHRLLPRDFDLDRPRDLERLRGIWGRHGFPAQALRAFLSSSGATRESSRRPEHGRHSKTQPPGRE